MRRKAEREYMSLNSLLDTITNVIGFLVLVLVVLNLDAGGKSLEIGPAAATEVDPGPMSPPTMDPNRIERVLKLRDGLAALLAQLDTKGAQARASRAAAPGKTKEIKTLKERIQDVLNEKDRIRRSIEEAEDQLAGLTKQVEEVRNQKPEQRVEFVSGVAVVDVSPKGGGKAAWEKKKEVTYVCRFGRVFPMDIRDKVDAAFTKVIGAKKSIDREDCRRFEAYFRDHDVGSEFFRATIVFLDLGPASTLMQTTSLRDPKLGESLESIRGDSSRLKKHLAALRPQEAWVRFLVWGDSFETYIEAEKVAKENKLETGWIPFDTAEELRWSVFGGGGGGGIGPQH